MPIEHLPVYVASLQLFVDGGALIYVATYIRGGIIESMSSPDKIEAVQWLSRRVFPTMDCRNQEDQKT